jgi:hypothetical protein
LPKLDISNKRFGRLLAVKFAFTKNKRSYWECVCDCGKVKNINITHLNVGKTKSCGCLNREIILKIRTKHGLYKVENNKEIQCYRNMINRCTNSKTKGFEHYGGRGIKICDRWLQGFEYFFTDMGKAPTKNHSLDRIDSNGNYEPSNCRWTTKDVQIKNRKPLKNKTGYSGVNIEKRGKKKFRSCIRLDNKTYYLGRYFTAKEAHEAWKKAIAIRESGEFLNWFKSKKAVI